MDKDGVVKNHIVYDAFGNVTLQTGSALPLFLYTGKLFDQDTRLQNNLNRWYDAKVGRWLSVDPIGFKAGDGNLYRYVENNTIGFIDINGLETLIAQYSVGIDDYVTPLKGIKSSFDMISQLSPMLGSIFVPGGSLISNLLNLLNGLFDLTDYGNFNIKKFRLDDTAVCRYRYEITATVPENQKVNFKLFEQKESFGFSVPGISASIEAAVAFGFTINSFSGTVNVYTYKRGRVFPNGPFKDEYFDKFTGAISGNGTIWGYAYAAGGASVQIGNNYYAMSTGLRASDSASVAFSTVKENTTGYPYLKFNVDTELLLFGNFPGDPLLLTNRSLCL